jgi:16S rRNA (cytosine1402-N4)-methyltransferase
MTKHKSVLKKEVIDLLKVKKEGAYLDLTLGGGGHSLEIASQLSSKGKLVCFELDLKAIERFESEHKKQNVIVVNTNFANIIDTLANLKIKEVDGIIADLGWSTDQLQEIEGLSYDRQEDKLDMRFDKNLGVSASDLLNVLSKSQLKQMFLKFADIVGRESNRLVDAIIEGRKLNGIKTVFELNQILEKEFGRQIGIKGRVYQSLRIAVNGEYDNLQKMLSESFDSLKIQGRFLVITFHSGEDRIVKEFIRERAKQNKIEVITENKDKLYITPSLDELKENISARSAKLWGYEKL